MDLCLKFLIDYNLFGMNYIYVEKFAFRRPLKQVDENGWQPPSVSDGWNVNTMNEYFLQVQIIWDIKFLL